MLCVRNIKECGSRNYECTKEQQEFGYGHILFTVYFSDELLATIDQCKTDGFLEVVRRYNKTYLIL